MTAKDVALLLSVIGFLMSAWGLVLAAWAIWDETHRRDLHPGWRNALEVAQSRVRSTFRRRPDVVARPHTVTGKARLEGSFSATASGVVTSHPQTIEELAAHVDRQLSQVREAITAQANDAASRIDALNVRVTEGLAEVATGLEAAERATAEIDAHTLNREMRGLLWVAAGSLLQTVAMFVAR